MILSFFGCTHVRRLIICLANIYVPLVRAVYVYDLIMATVFNVAPVQFLHVDFFTASNNKLGVNTNKNIKREDSTKE